MLSKYTEDDEITFIIVTEPAVGFGLGLAPTFFHDFNHPGTKQKDLTVEEFLAMVPGPQFRS